MSLYHVSCTRGLKTLQPRVSTHGKAWVYAVRDLTTGLLFGARHDDFDYILSNRDDGLPMLWECYPGAMKQVYENKSCSVYEVGEDGFEAGMTGWSPELVCGHEVEVLRETVVDDLYSRLLSEEADGRLKIYYWNDTIEYKRRISGHIVDRLIRFDAIRHFDNDPRGKYFRKLIDGLIDITDGHLL